MNIHYYIKEKIRLWQIRNFHSKIESSNLNFTSSLKKYIDLFSIESSENLDANSNEVRYVVLDTETTGLNSKKDQILSIGAIAIRGKSIIFHEMFYEIIYLNREKGKDITIHGIMPNESKQGKEEFIVLQDFINFIGNSIIIGHHIDFDLDFLNTTLSKYTTLKILNRKIDTLLISETIEQKMNPHLYVQDRSRFQLDILLNKYNIPQISRHNALSDALSTAILFLILKSKMMQLGYTKLKDYF